MKRIAGIIAAFLVMIPLDFLVLYRKVRQKKFSAEKITVIHFWD